MNLQSMTAIVLVVLVMTLTRTCDHGGQCTGGRVTGREVIAELVEELRGSVAAAEQFEGEMRNLAAYAKALAQALDCIRTAGGNRWAIATHPRSQIKYVFLRVGGQRQWDLAD